MIGKQISHYRVLEELGRGGMGVVYRAEDLKLARIVALKFLPPQALGNADEKSRFVREAQAAAVLSHPNIATVFEIDEAEGQEFIAMEYIEGKSLKEIVEFGPMKLQEALDIASQIAEGLHAAHEKGIVHRDMKSANVMVTPKGQVKIMDFGLAKLKGVSLLTRQGTTLGTVSYMSPEQARGEKVDRRTDIWSLGVVLYEMVAGRLPYRGDFDQAILYAILNGEPEPITSVRSNVPMELERAISKMMARDPADRYQNVQEIPVDLRGIKASLKGSSGLSRISTAEVKTISPARPARTSLLPWILAGVMAVAAGVMLWSPWRPAPGLRSVMRFSITLDRANAAGLITYPAIAISPDGSRIVYRADTRLYLRTVDDLEAKALPGTEDGESPFFSPDGQWIGFFSGGKLKKVGVSGGTPIVLAEAPDNRGGDWGPDGSITFAAGPTTGLSRVQEGGGSVREVTTKDSLHDERTHRWPHLLPDGKTVLFTVGTRESPDYYEDARIEAANLETGSRKMIVNGASSAEYLSTGHLVYSRSGMLYAVPFDVGRLEVRGSPMPVLEGVNGDPTTGAMHYAVSSNGTLVYFPGQLEGAQRVVTILDTKGEETTIGSQGQTYLEPRISPDGKRIAVVISSERNFDIWIFDIERKTLSRLTFGGTNRTPAWSPDSKRVAYWAGVQGQSEGGSERKAGIYIKPADGSGSAESVLETTSQTYVDSWSHDGSVLILDVVKQTTQSDVWVLPLTGDRKPWTFIGTSADEWQASLSPDGKWLAYISNETGAYQVYVRPFPGGGGKWQISVDGGSEPHWTRDGKTLYYVGNGKMMAVPVSTTPSFQAGQPRVLFEGYQPLPMDSGVTYDLAPDGVHFVTTRQLKKSNFQQIDVVLNWFTELKSRMGAVR